MFEAIGITDEEGFALLFSFFMLYIYIAEKIDFFTSFIMSFLLYSFSLMLWW